MSVNAKAGDPPKFGLCIDFETSGASQNPKDHTIEYQGVSYGALIFEFESLEPIDGVYAEIQFNDMYKWSPEAEKVHGLSREYLAKHGKKPVEAAMMLAELMLKYLGPRPHVWVMAHNRDFDLMFMEQLLRPYELMPSVCHVALDTSPLGLLTVGKYRSDDLFDLFCDTHRCEHNALDDALACLTVAKSIRQIFWKGLGIES